jgi:hypothetical protein
LEERGCCSMHLRLRVASSTLGRVRQPGLRDALPHEAMRI